MIRKEILVCIDLRTALTVCKTVLYTVSEKNLLLAITLTHMNGF